MAYEINGGRILTWALEAHAVDHCNLSCANCCTLSPDLAPRFADASALGRDLALAARALRPHVFKLTGGEPLLHPDVAGLLDAARASGIAERISVTTNGLLLDRQPDAFFERIDRLTVSRYPGVALRPAAMARIARRCERHGVLLTVKEQSHFQTIDAPAPHEGDEATRAVFASCWMRVRCHLVHEGRFYCCTRPPHIEAVLRARGMDEPLARDDGVPLDGPGLAARILRYLEREDPLRSCRHCLGTGGPWVTHEQRRTARASP